MFDGRLEGTKDFFIPIVMIDIDDYRGDKRNDVLQYLALHRREIEEAVEHEQIDFIEPRQLTIVIFPDHLQCPKLIRVFIGQIEFVERRRIRRIDLSDVAIEIYLGAWRLSFRFWTLNFGCRTDFCLAALDRLTKFIWRLAGALNLTNQRSYSVDTTVAVGERPDRRQFSRRT